MTNYYRLLSEEDTREYLFATKNYLLTLFFKHQDKLSETH